MQIKFVDLGAQDAHIRDSLAGAMIRVLDQGDYILGEDVGAFEEEFARFCGTRYAVGVSSGLAALELILRAHDIGPGDEVIVPSFTFTGTAAAVSLVGATPVFAEVDQTYTLSAPSVEAAITPRTKAVIAVHLYGRPANMDSLRAVTDRAGVKLFEDAAQAHGATYRGRRVGQLADAAGFSFYPSKNLGANGDAGAVTTNDPDVAERIRALRNCGQVEKNVHSLTPCNHRLDTVQAAALRIRLAQLETWNEARRRVAGWYRSALEGLPVALPPDDDDDTQQVWHLFVVRAEDRDTLRDRLAELGVPTGVHYPIPVHLQPFYKGLRHAPGDFPSAEEFSSTVLSLPMHPTLDQAAVQYVADALRNLLSDALLVSQRAYSPGL